MWLKVPNGLDPLLNLFVGHVCWCRVASHDFVSPGYSIVEATNRIVFCGKSPYIWPCQS